MQCGAMQCNITCGPVRLCHFASDFDAIFTVCTVFTVWWTPLDDLIGEPKESHVSYISFAQIYSILIYSKEIRDHMGKRFES